MLLTTNIYTCIKGFKGHYSKTVNLNDDDDVHFKLKQQMDKMETGKDPYDLHDFINNAVIVARQDLIPIHELLDIQHDEKVKDLIQRRFNQISVGSPIKMYNSASDCYLAWSPRHSDDNYGDDFVVRPLPGNDQLSTRSDKQCLWQLAWPTLIEQPHASSIIRAGTCICVHPACKTKLRKRINPDLSYTVQVDTQNRMLVCQPSQMDSDPKATIRPLRLKTPGELLNENNTTWRIEYPSSDSQITLDIDQSIHKLKPVVEGDTIQLKQMGVLTAFDTDLLKMTDKTFIQSLRKVKRIRKLDGSKTKSRMALMCIDQQDALNGYSNNTYWTIQLATADDVARCHYALKNDFAEQDDSLVTFESSWYYN
jgi:hypothetical protein